MAQHVVCDLVDQPLAVGARQAALELELGADVGEHPGAQRDRVHLGVEELRSKVADHGEVDAVLELRERVGRAASSAGRMPGQALLEIHQQRLLSRSGAALALLGRPR